jgi:fibronectin-binding autotransporter adhesin
MQVRKNIVVKRWSNLVAAMIFIISVQQLSAATINRNNASSNLNTTGAWTGGVAPGSADVAQWQSGSSTGSQTMGGNLTWGQISITNPGGAITIANTGSFTLTLNGISGTGISMSSATQNLTLNPTIALGASQTWDIGTSRTLTIGGTINGSGNTITKSGAGTVTLNASNLFNNVGLSLSAGTVLLTTGNNQVRSFSLANLSGSGGTIQMNGNNSPVSLTVGSDNTSTSFSGTFNEIGNSSTILSLTKTGTGTLTLSGANAVYDGTTTVDGGTLVLARTVTNTILGNLTIGDGTGTDIVRLDQTNQISDSVNATINSSGVLRLNGNSDTIAALSGSGTVENSHASTASTLTVSGTTSQIFSGVLQNGGVGALSLTKSGTGTLIFSGTASTYTGTTTVSNGTLSVATVSGATSSIGNATSAVVLGDASNQGVLSYTGNSATYTRGFTVNAGDGRVDVTTSGETLTINTGNITGTGDFTTGGAGNTTIDSAIQTGSGRLIKVDSGTLVVAGSNTYTGGTNINGGVLSLGTGVQALGGTGTVASVGTITFGGGTLQFSSVNQVDYSSRFSSTAGQAFNIDTNGQDVTFGSQIISTAGGAAGTLTKLGSGKLTLGSALSRYTGATTISGGALSVGVIANGGADSSIGRSTAAAANLVFDGGALQYTGGTAVSDRAFTINAAKTATIEVATGAANLSLAGATGTATTGALTKTGAGTLTLTGANSYTGATSVSAGTLAVNGSLSAGGAAVSVGAATLSGTGTINRAVQLGGSSTVSSTGTLTVGAALTANGASNQISSGTVSTTGDTINGALAVAGTLGGTGIVDVNNGATLSVSGNVNKAIDVNSGGTLLGAGTVSGASTIAGTISPGNSPGTMTFGATQTWSSDGGYLWEINDATGTQGSNPGWDLVNITSGNLDVNSSQANPFTLFVTSLSGNSPGSAANFNNTQNYTWTIATAVGGIQGFSGNNVVIDSTGFQNDLGGGNFSLAASGNDLNLHFNATPIPEPGTLAASLLLIGGVIWSKRRRMMQAWNLCAPAHENR